MSEGIVGTVLERDGATYHIATEAGLVRAVLRGRIKGRAGPKVVVGDRVDLETGGDPALYGIAAVRPRRTVLARRVPEGRGLRPIVANVDQVVVVTAVTSPEPVPQLLDRLLAIAEVNRLPAIVTINKIDLAPGDALARRFEAAGYPVVETSARSGSGVEHLRQAFTGKASVVTGPSGVGKSSLLNAVEPECGLRVRAVSAKIRRGRQTTVGAVMLPLAAGGYVIDTPGLGEVGLWGVRPEELDQCFPEFRALQSQCRFGDCRHHHEPDCAIRAALEEGTILADRYASYLALLEEAEAEPKPWE